MIEICRDMVLIREAYLHKNGGCICKDRAIDHPEHSMILIAHGFDGIHGCRTSMAKLANIMQKRPLAPPAVREIVVRLEFAIRESLRDHEHFSAPIYDMACSRRHRMVHQ